jgi:hypothetical protein
LADSSVAAKPFPATRQGQGKEQGLEGKAADPTLWTRGEELAEELPEAGGEEYALVLFDHKT